MRAQLEATQQLLTAAQEEVLALRDKNTAAKETLKSLEEELNGVRGALAVAEQKVHVHARRAIVLISLH